ncbi:MAG: hypothetical protein ACSHW1_19450 [Yoonia sp.]
MQDTPPPAPDYERQALPVAEKRSVFREGCGGFRTRFLGPNPTHRNAAHCIETNQTAPATSVPTVTSNRPERALKGTIMFKTATLAIIAIAASATIASADSNYINSLAKEQASKTNIELGLVRSNAAGVVEIYSFHRGEVGKLLGSTDVHAGANPDVDVNIRRATTNAIAVLKVGGQIVETQEIDFN